MHKNLIFTTLIVTLTFFGSVNAMDESSAEQTITSAAPVYPTPAIPNPELKKYKRMLKKFNNTAYHITRIDEPTIPINPENHHPAIEDSLKKIETTFHSKNEQIKSLKAQNAKFRFMPFVSGIVVGVGVALLAQRSISSDTWRSMLPAIKKSN